MRRPGAEAGSSGEGAAGGSGAGVAILTVRGGGCIVIGARKVAQFCPGTGCLTEQFTYDYNILKPLTYTDLNGNKTSLTYYPDPLDRLLNVTRPDTGQTSFTYNDAPGTCATGNQIGRASCR